MGFSNFTSNNSTGTTPPSNNGGGTPCPPSSPLMQEDFDITECLINYNEKYKTAGPAMYRDKTVQQTIAVLIGMLKPNPLLFGAAGTGKTKIVEDIAYRLANNDTLIPDSLKGYTIYELPLSNIVAGSSFVGQLEAKVNAIVEFFEDPTNKAICFIDEIHQLVAGNQTYDKIAQILKPALARGDIKVIGATTLQEANNLNDDPAFNRRFSRIIVDELSQEQTFDIIKNLTPKLIQNYNNKITVADDVLTQIVKLADHYKRAGSHRPDNAITLLDRAMGDAIVKRHAQEIKAQQTNNQQILAAFKMMPIIPLSESQVKATAVRLMTGFNEKTELNVDELTASLARIKGQDDAVRKTVQMLREKDAGCTDPNTPLTLLFTGPSGVGKTEVAKIIAQNLTDTKPIVINMTEYHSSASINRIIGSPAGYVGSDSHSELPFDILESNPYQVIILDEFEKGDRAVQRLFMQAFHDGYIKTNRGKIIDFSKAIIIATTNAGYTTHTANIGFNEDTSKPTKEQVVKELSQWFDIALLNRFSDIIPFNEITKEIYTTILKENYIVENNRIRTINHRAKTPDVLSDDEAAKIADDTYVTEFGARPAAKAVRKYIASLIL